MRDKDFGSIRLRGYGSYAFKVSNPEVFLKEMAGTNSSFTTEDIEGYLRSQLITCISDTIAESKISALDLSANLNEFSKVALEDAKLNFLAFGLELTKLNVESLSFPEEIEKALDQRSSMGIMSDSMDDFIKYQSAQALRDVAKKEGNVSAGVDLGTGLAFGQMMRDALSPSPKLEPKKKEGKFCPECGTENKKTAKFCTECGTKLVNTKNCPSCKAEMPAKAKFCPECGTKA